MAAWIAMNVAVSCLGLAASMKVCKWRYGKKKGMEMMLGQRFSYCLHCLSLFSCIYRVMQP